jgi:hypothetical protein
VRVPLLSLRDDYFRSMHWDTTSGRLARQRAQALGISDLLAGHLAS